MAKSNIVVVGGGGAGTAIARGLSEKLDNSRFNLILVTLSDRHIHLPAYLRMSVNGPDVDKLTEDAVIPYTSLFVNGKGTVKVGKVVRVVTTKGAKGGSIELESGETLPFTYLVLATGSTWEGPLAPIGTEESVQGKLQGHIRSWREKFDKANGVIIVGGGAVGLELAGELRDVYEEKAITIVHANDLPLNDSYPEKFRRNVIKRWEDRNINFVLGDRIEEIPDVVTTSVRTGKGEVVQGDLIVPAIGGKPNTAFLRELGPDVLDNAGRVKTQATLQLEKFPDIFAAGDILSFAEQKQLAKYAGHAAVIVPNILSLTKGEKPVKVYKGTFEALFLTNGLKKGFGYLGALWGLTFGNSVVGSVKSKGLFVSMARKNLGFKA